MKRVLTESGLGPDPLAAFGRWFREAQEAEGRLPEAVALATASAAGEPSARMVLLKGFDERGFVFFSGYESRKGRELTENPRAALLFYWPVLGRQVRVEGPVARVAEEESRAYFDSRPYGSRLSALASRQSQPGATRKELEERVERLQREYEGREPPLPPAWGGYRLEPELYEFWQHREDRLHDRLRFFRCDGGDWVVERLEP